MVNSFKLPDEFSECRYSLEAWRVDGELLPMRPFVEWNALSKITDSAVLPSGFFISYICDLFSSFMCGRYRRTTQEEELARLYHIPIPRQTDLPISYNIAPSQKVLTIRFNRENQLRSLDALQWGLIPYWAKDPKISYRTINARAETVDKAPSFRQAFMKRRCLIPADGFYEWRKTAKPKLPFAIAMKDGRPFTFAGLWENWKDPGSGEWLRTCTIITGEPNELVAQIHPRMPVILPEQHHAAWLGETDDGDLKALLLPYPADQMRMWEISPQVNSPKNDDPSLWEPHHSEPTQTTTDTPELLRE